MVGEAIRRARQKAGLSQEAVADKAGLHRTYISLVERNKKSPTLDTLFRICQAIGVSTSAIVKRVEDMCNEDS